MPLADVSDTGLGATIAFSSTTFAARVVGITNPTWSVEKLDDSTLASTGYKKFIPSDLVDPGEVTVEIMWPTSLALPTIGGASETITITFPLRSGAGGEGTAANIAGTGFFSEIVVAPLQIGTIQKGSFKIVFDGGTGPTNTIAIAA